MPNGNSQAGGFGMGASNGNGGSVQGPGIPGTSSLLGTNDLQTSIDNLSSKVNSLDSAVNKLSGLFSQATSKPKSTSSQHNSPSSWQTSPVQSPFTYIKQWATGTLPSYGPQNNNGGGAAVPQFRSMFGASASGNAGGPPGTGGTGGGKRNGGGPNGFANGGVLGGVAAIGKSFMQYGSSQLPTQVGMSSYVQTATLSMNGGYSAANANLARYAAFGGRGQNLNGLASNASDAIAGQQIVNYIAGQGAVTGGTANSYGRYALGATSLFGLGNQSLSYGQSAQLAAMMGSPSTSTRMLQYGFPVTPRMMGGGMRSATSVAQGLIQGFYGGRSVVNPKTLAFSLREGGNAQTTLQGMYGGQWSDVANMLQAENTVSWNARGKLNSSQVQSLFNQAARGSTSQMQSAQAQLQKYGLNTSDIQSIKDLNSVKTGRSADVANSFNSGLQSSVGLLTQFNNILSKIVDLPGINQLVGGSGGFLGGMGSLTNGATMGLGMAGGSMLLKGVLGKMFGGGAAARAAGAAAGDSALVAGAGGAGLGALGGALLPAAAVGGTLFGLSKIHNKNGTNWLQQGPGGPHGGWNSWSQAGKNLKNWFVNDPGNWAITDPVSGIKKLFDVMTGGPSTAGAGAAYSRFGGSPNYLPTRPGGAAGISSAGGSARKTASASMGGASGAAKTAVTDAEQELGKPYVYGGDSPRVGFDCSGLVMWAYGQAGVRLPRTSQEQWAYLSHGHSVDLNKVQEGDIVFQAGSDGSATAPGHEALMISNRQIIEAPYTGANIRIRAYNPKEWQHAGRPTGGSAGATVTTNTSSSTANSGSAGTGNAGLGMASGTYGSSEELDTLTSALLGAGGGVNTGFTNGRSSSSGGAKGSSGKGGGPNVAGITGGGSIAANKALMKKLAAAYGWGSGAEWSAQDALEMSEAGYDNKIWNGTGSGAYGMAQALPASKYPLAGRPPSMGGKSDPKTQIVWMLDYEKSTYGDPINAWNFHKAHNWYADGTMNARGGWSWAGERGPELVWTNSGDKVLSSSMSEHLSKQSQKGVQTTLWRANLPDVTPVSPAAASATSGGVTLNFHKGSVVISSGLADSGQVSKSATEFVSKVAKLLKDEQMYAQIAAG